MDLVWMEDFLALVETGSFSRAAEQRHISQPAFSRRIRALEDWAGASLFDRRLIKTELTAAGESFQPVAEDLVRRLEQARLDLLHAARNASATLHFAATHALSMAFVPSWLQSLADEFESSSIRLTSESMKRCEQVMLAGSAQFLIAHTHPHVPVNLDPRQFRSVRLGNDEIVPVAAPTASGAPRYALPGTADAELPLLDYSQDSGVCRIIRTLRSSDDRQVWLKPVFSSHHSAVLKTLACNGRGVAWLPRRVIASELGRSELVPAGDASWEIPVDIRIFRPRARISPAAERFWSLLAQ